VRLAGHVARMGEEENYRLLVRKPDGKRPLGRWLHNIKLNWIF
jgi:hypothetical protein